jgi:polysaccharide export outer membrane protein
MAVSPTITHRRAHPPAKRHLLRLSLLLACLLPAGALQAQQTIQAADAAKGIRPGDVVRLRIWREPDMSGEFPVDEAGRVVFPRVGEYDVGQDTPESLSERLQADYRRYLVNPSIEVTVLRRVRVIGAVTRPGLIQVDPTVTLADAIALAGGATPIGDPKKIRIIRGERQIAMAISQSTRIADSPIQSGDQIYVPERSWASRNSGVVVAAITGTLSLALSLFLR